MRILLIGASGYLGSAVIARLAKDGHSIVGIARGIRAISLSLPQVKFRSVDIAKASPEDWAEYVEGIDVVVNCAGIMQGGLGESVQLTQATAMRLLYTACEQANVRRFIQVSALGIEREASEFSRTKKFADHDLSQRNLNWVILRPSIIVGHGVAGGSALLRAAAALPWMVPVFSDNARVQPVFLADVVETVSFFIDDDAPCRLSVDLPGPQSFLVHEVIQRFRRWTGRREGREVRIPNGLSKMLFLMGDIAAYFGWRPALRSNAHAELLQATEKSGHSWQRVTSINPQPLDVVLRDVTATTQEKWYAHLLLLKPLMIVVLVAFWIGTGLLALGPGHGYAVALMKEGGASDLVAKVTVWMASLLDIGIGIAMAFRRTAQAALIASIFVSLAYVVIGTLILPRLWADPLGPMTKMWPVIVMTVATLAVLEER
jgi:uncharacterized protein YbjT (DUF2867 family)